MGITQAILRLRCIYAKQYDATPQDVNGGLCEDFAGDIVNMGFGNVIWSGAHCFVLYNGKYFDSECPQGCNHPDKLPFYLR